MATLAEQRRSIAAGMRASRQGTSEAARRAAGAAMIARRTGRDEVDDINAVVRQPRQRRALPTVEPRGSAPAQVGTGNYTAPPASTGGGIASPLTEKTRIEQDQQGNNKTVPDRDYYAGGFTSSDGLFVLPAVSVQRMTDANGAEVVFQFANPQGTVPVEEP